MRLRSLLPAAAWLAAATAGGHAAAASTAFAGATATATAAARAATVRTVADTAAELFGVSDLTVFTPDVFLRTDGGTDIVVPIDGVPTTVRVYPYSVRADGYRLRAQVAGGAIVEMDPGPSRLVRGMIHGVSGTSAVGSQLDDGLHLSIRLDDGTRLWIEPIAGRVAGAGAGDHVLYRNDAILPTGATCGFAAEVDGVLADRAPADGAIAAAGGGVPTLCVTELANDADVEYFNDYGSVGAVQDRIELIVATVNLQYESEVGITHVVTDTLVRTAEPDPYTVNTNTELLCQFINEWTNNQQGIQRDVAHLFTGRSISGSVIGQAAALGSICEPQGCSSFPCNCGPFGTAGSYCFAESDFNNNFASATDLTAHELGHLWDASHCSCPTFTMNPSITSANTFEPSVTRPTIEAYRDSRPCLDCLEAVTFDYPDGIPSVLDPAGGTTVRVVVTEELSVPQPGTGLLHLDTGSGFVTSPMTEVSPNVYDAVFPVIDCPTAVSFFFSVEVPGVGQVTSPGGAPGQAFTATAANSVAVVFDDDFETNQGWTVQNSPGLSDGAWDRGVPAGGGVRGDPPVDGDGSGQCYVTDNEAGNSDVDGGSTTLVSPLLDATGGNTVLSYFRWYDNSFGASPNADVFTVEGSDDGGATWVPIETVGPAGPQSNGGWFSVSIALADVGLDPTNQVRVRFTAEDAGDGSVVEAGVDGVQLVSADCTTMVPCPGDVDMNGTVGFDDLVSVLAAFGPCDGCPEDVDMSGDVGFSDIVALLAAWGPCPG